MKKVLVQITLNPIEVSDDTDLLKMLAMVQADTAHFVRREVTPENVSVRIRFVDDPKSVRLSNPPSLLKQPEDSGLLD